VAQAPRALREAAWFLAGLALALTVAAVAVVLVTRTERGREEVLAFTLERLGAGVHGKLDVARLDGDLFTGAKLYGVALRGEDGEPFVLADSAFLNYDLRTLVTPRILIEELVLYDPEVYVTQLPGDTLWNYQKIFARDPNAAPGPERITILDRVRVVNGHLKAQYPFVPDERLSPREQQVEIREALADTSPLLVRRVPGGLLRTVEASGLNGVISQVRFAPGTEKGTYANVERLSGTVKFYRTPFRLREVRGEVAVLQKHVELRAPRLVMNTSPLSAAGTIRFGERRGDSPWYDITFRSDSVALGDLRWLWPRFPREARGSLSLVVETRSPEEVMILARDMRLQAPGTRLTGDFGMIFGGDTLRFVDVELRADPLRVALIEEMLPGGMPVRGLRIGSAELRGASERPREVRRGAAARAQRTEAAD